MTLVTKVHLILDGLKTVISVIFRWMKADIVPPVSTPLHSFDTLATSIFADSILRQSQSSTF